MKAAVRSFPTGSSPGPSGLRPSHLLQAIQCPSASRSHPVLLALASFSSVAAAGKIPSEVIPFLCGANLLASLKKRGGIRPIAVGNVLRRLISKCLSAFVKSDAIHALAPLQLGVGVSGGADVIIHAANLIHSDDSIPISSKATLQVDFSNAFNQVDRKMMFQEIRSRLPSLALWLECCYGSTPPILWFGNQQLVWSTAGGPPRPLGFCSYSTAFN